MEIENWLDSEFKIIRNRESKSISDKVANLASRGLLNSGTALPDCMNSGLATLRDETIRVIDELEKFVYLTNRDFQTIQIILERKINEDFDSMYMQCIGDNEFNNRKEQFQFVIENIHSYVKSHIAIQVHLNRKKKLQILWEIAKMVLPAVIGGIIGYSLKALFP